MMTIIGWSADGATQFAIRLTISTGKRRIESFSSLSIHLSRYHQLKQDRSIVCAHRCAIRRRRKARITTQLRKRTANAVTAVVAVNSESFRELMTLALLFVATCFLAYSNGANDNFKGVASLFGSRTCNYRMAISWATVTTFAGSIMAIFLAQTLLNKFGGKGIVPDHFVGSEYSLLAVAIGARL